MNTTLLLVCRTHYHLLLDCLVCIDHLIESTDYSQVFLVSHYQDGYSSLNSSEVLVLCDSNIELPKGMAYNHHAQFH